MSTTAQNCKSCKFFNLVPQAGPGIGQCRRYPPSVMTIQLPPRSNIVGAKPVWSTETLFPVVNETISCGEFSARLTEVQ